MKYSAKNKKYVSQALFLENDAEGRQMTTT